MGSRKTADLSVISFTPRVPPPFLTIPIDNGDRGSGPAIADTACAVQNTAHSIRRDRWASYQAADAGLQRLRELQAMPATRFAQ